MQIEITVPIIVNDFLICEFDAAIDVNVVSYGCPAQTSGPPEYCYPAESPEWEIEATYVEVKEKNEQGEFVSKLIECPGELLIFMTQYTEREEFQDKVCCLINEDDSPDYYEPEYQR